MRYDRSITKNKSGSTTEEGTKQVCQAWPPFGFLCKTFLLGLVQYFFDGSFRGVVGRFGPRFSYHLNFFLYFFHVFTGTTIGDDLVPFLARDTIDRALCTSSVGMVTFIKCFDCWEVFRAFCTPVYRQRRTFQ